MYRTHYFLAKVIMWPYSWIELVLAGARFRWKSEIMPLVMTYCNLMRLSINKNEGTRPWFTMVYWTRSKILIILHNTVIKPFNIYWVKLMSLIKPAITCSLMSQPTIPCHLLSLRRSVDMPYSVNSAYYSLLYHGIFLWLSDRIIKGKDQ